MSNEIERHIPNTEYTREEKARIAIHYATTGSLTKTAKALNVPKGSMQYIKNNWDEWDSTVTSVRTEKTEEHIAQYNQIIELAQEKAIELLPSVTSAREAVLVACMSEDKSLLLQGRPTSIRGDSSSVHDLAEQFRKLAQDHENIQNSVVNTNDNDS